MKDVDAFLLGRRTYVTHAQAFEPMAPGDFFGDMMNAPKKYVVSRTLEKPIWRDTTIIRDNVVVHEGKLSTLKRFKDEVKEVDAGQECGMAFENYQDMRQGDVIECYRVEEIKRTL